MARRIAAALAVLLAPFMLTGCILLELEFRAAEQESERRYGATPCADAACSRERWRVFAVGSHQLVMKFGWPDDPDNIIVTVADNPADGRRAFATHTGRLLVASDPDTEPAEVAVDGAVLGAAWSNDGRRLALVLRDADATHRLQVFDADPNSASGLTVAVEWPVELADVGPPPTPQLWRFIMSWSADDALIAISHDEFRGATYPAALVVRLERGESYPFGAFAAFFIDEVTLVANPTSALPGELDHHSPGRLTLFDVRADSVVATGNVDGPQRAVASDPLTGVFLSLEVSFTRGIQIGPNLPLGLRTRATGADLVTASLWNADYATYILLPK